MKITHPTLQALLATHGYAIRFDNENNPLDPPLFVAKRGHQRVGATTLTSVAEDVRVFGNEFAASHFLWAAPLHMKESYVPIEDAIPWLATADEAGVWRDSRNVKMS